MTRGRIIALLVFVAAVIVMVPFAPDLWWNVAYRTDEGTDLYERTWAMILIVPGDQDTYTKSDKALLVKRASWLPGQEYHVGPAECATCVGGNHGKCTGRVEIVRWINGVSIETLASASCDCDHVQESGK